MEEFYEKKFYFSYSSIHKLLYSPVIFYNHYILRQREDSTESFLVEGKLIHLLLLEPEKFDDMFIIMNCDIPSTSIKNIIDRVYNKHHLKRESSMFKTTEKFLDDYEEEILIELQEQNLYQSLKEDSKRLEKVISTETKKYFDFLKEKEGKILITQDIYNKCENSVNIIKNDEKISDLLKLNNDDLNIEVYNELFIEIDLLSYEFGLKGVIDNLVVDKKNKIITINDLKTTSKSISEFRSSVEHYDYWMQCVIYYTLVKSKFKDLIDDNWKIYFNFVVIDKYDMIYAFSVTSDTFKDWVERFKLSLKAVEYHYINKEYKLPYLLAIDKLKL
jgi:hypothetical protein